MIFCQLLLGLLKNQLNICVQMEATVVEKIGLNLFESKRL